MQCIGFQQTSTKFMEIFVPYECFLYRKQNSGNNPSGHLTDSSDMCCSNLYLINIFTKSTKEMHRRYVQSLTVEDLNLQQKFRYEDMNILGTRCFFLLDAALGA